MGQTSSPTEGVMPSVRAALLDLSVYSSKTDVDSGGDQPDQLDGGQIDAARLGLRAGQPLGLPLRPRPIRDGTLLEGNPA